MSHFWISLPEQYKLEDVQAVLNVIVTALSALSIFVFVRYCWQRAAKQIAKTTSVPIYSLLSVNTFGEVLDIVILLKHNLVSFRYIALLTQCMVIICFSITTIMSGPIVRYSTGLDSIVREKEVNGFLASRAHNGMGNANVEWNLTYSRLENAGFPHNQLIDFLPDNSVDWKFIPDQWNNSWTLHCLETPQTNITLQATGNCSGTLSELPGLENAFSYTKWDDYWHDWSGFYNSSTTDKDVLLFVYGVRLWGYNETEDTFLSVNMMTSSIHLHGVPRPDQNASEDCNFGVGRIDEASYTKIECNIQRNHDVQDYFNVAYPDVLTPLSVPAAFTQYYSARFIQQSTSDAIISVITPQELIRFYQTYTINKDLQYRQPVIRLLSVEVVVVHLSTVFLAFVLLVVLLDVLGLATYGTFVIRFYNIMTTTPQSKLDWAIQSARQVSGISPVDEKQALTRTVSIDYGDQTPGFRHALDRKGHFEKAHYGENRTSLDVSSSRQSFKEYHNSPSIWSATDSQFCECKPGRPAQCSKRMTPIQTTVREIKYDHNA